jgi:lysine-arginine-ornithine-binding protein
MQTIKKTVCALLLVCATSLTHAFDKNEIRMGVEGAFPPFNEIGVDGKPSGFDVDIGNALCAQLKVRCSWVVQDWDGMIPALMSGKFDTIMSSMTNTAERHEKIAFTDKYYAVSSRLVAKAGSALDPTKPQTLVGKRLGVQRATPHESYANAVLAPQGIRIVSYPTQDEVFSDLRNGRLDAVLADTPVAATSFIDKPQGNGFAFVGEPITDPAFFGDGIGIGARKDDTELVQRLNGALAAIRESGEYQRIQQRYFTFDIYTGL